jgi:hypothetical protein
MLRAVLTSVTLLGSALAADYFPSAPGTTWRYSNGETQQFGAPRSVRGVNVRPLAHSIVGRKISEDLLEYTPAGVYLRGVQTGSVLTWYTPPLLLYPTSPLFPGMQWESAGSGLRLSSRVMGQEAIKLAGGSYNALVIRTEASSSGGAASTRYAYFVPGYGTVRFVSEDGKAVDLLK